MARQVSMYLMRTLTDLSLQAIGEQYEGRNHATVLSSIRKVEELMQRTQHGRRDPGHHLQHHHQYPAFLIIHNPRGKVENSMWRENPFDAFSCGKAPFFHNCIQQPKTRALLEAFSDFSTKIALYNIIKK